jgi:hypothetical protein
VNGPWLQHPDWLMPAALGIATAAIGLALGRLLARRRRLRLLGPRAPRLDWSDAALLLALGALGVALLGPRLGMRSERVEAAGAGFGFWARARRGPTGATLRCCWRWVPWAWRCSARAWACAASAWRRPAPTWWCCSTCRAA